MKRFFRWLLRRTSKRRRSLNRRKRLREHRRRLWKASPRCVYCLWRMPFRWASLDHVYPVSKGGTDEHSNLVLCCQNCNLRKGDRLLSRLVRPVTVGRISRFKLFILEALTMTNIAGFNYEIVDASYRRRVQDHVKQIHTHLHHGTEAVIDIGKRLAEVREKLGAGTFSLWIHAEFRWSQPTASNYMRAAAKFGDLDCLPRFHAMALFQLARKKVDPRAIKDAVKEAKSGETITRKRANELIVKYRDRTKPAPQPMEVNRLRSSVRQLSESLETVLQQLSAEQTRSLADQLLELALRLRQATAVETPAVEESTPATAAKPKLRRRKAAKQPKPAAASA